ncbi:MAG: transcription antitermination factor NusB, partial [bacterium]|nr:transcription antitermination factor NusB [bacterium]
MKQNRRQCREEALQMIYSLAFNPRPFDEAVKDSSIIRADDSKFDEFTVDLVKKTVDASRECDKLIETHSSNWSFERIALIDKLILRLALTEFLFFPDIPPKVTINEALEVAKKFSTTKSSIFVNGVLDSALKELKDSSRIYK